MPGSCNLDPMHAHDDAASPTTRMRFQDPETFLAFHDKQLDRSLVGVRHPRALPEGSPIRVIVSPPGAPDQLRLTGRVQRVTPRADGTARLRVRVEPSPADRAWLRAYVAGLRAGVGAALRSPTASLDQLDGATYYALLGVEPDADVGHVRARFVEAIGRVDDERHGRLLRRLTEAYGVLRDPRLRAAYDAGLAGPAESRQLRLEPHPHPSAPARSTDAIGEQYWRMARHTLEQARGAGLDRQAAAEEALRLLRVACFFAPAAAHIQHALEHVGTLVGRR